MKRRILGAFAAAGLVLLLRTAGFAVGIGSLKLQLAREGEPVRDAEVLVYRVGTAVVGGYRLREAFGGGFIAEADVLFPELSEWLARQARGEALRGQTDEGGEAFFDALEEGLYLVVQEGGRLAFEPFVLIIPWDGNVWDITAAPKMNPMDSEPPETGDPGALERGLWGMAITVSAIWALWKKKGKYIEAPARRRRGD